MRPPRSDALLRPRSAHSRRDRAGHLEASPAIPPQRFDQICQPRQVVEPIDESLDARHSSGTEHQTRQLTEFRARSEEHTSELQSLAYLVCRLLLEKKKKNNTRISALEQRP